MSKKTFDKAIPLRQTLDLNKIERDLLASKKVMLPLGKKYNDRLSHSNDVEYVAKKIFKHLISNYDSSSVYMDTLCATKIKTMAQWHDVGHCPYGHAGEDMLNSLISENEDLYHDSFYSGYKHNLLSAKLILDTQKNISWDIVDAVIKHSSVLPSNFNFSRANDDNILKLNYIFNCDKNNIVHKQNQRVAVNQSWYMFMKKFIKIFPCSVCGVTKYNFISYDTKYKHDAIKICSEGKNKCQFCVLKNDHKTKNTTEAIKNNITKYLLFPHPLTLNGDIIRIADEISALVRDIEFYFKFLKGKNKQDKYYIIAEHVINKVNILKSKFIDDTDACLFIDKVKELIFAETSGDDLIDFLIKNIEYDPSTFKIIEKKEFNNVPIIIRWNDLKEKKYCRSLLSFNKNIDVLFKEIKNAIYCIIHNDKSIKKDNDAGKKYIQKVFEYYYKHPSEFLEINSHLNDELNSITNKIKYMAFESLVEKINFAKDNIAENNDSMKLLNSFRREIAFYIARLGEPDLKKLCKQIKNK